MLGSEVFDTAPVEEAMFDWVTSAAYDPWHLMVPESPSTTACGKTFAVFDQRPTSDLPFPVDLCPACRSKAMQRTEAYIG